MHTVVVLKSSRVRYFFLVTLLFISLIIGSFIFIHSHNASAATVNVTTQHNDNNRSGANLNETVLNTSNVNPTNFGKIFTRAVDGQIYAQPLYVSSLTVAGKGVHNVVFVATMNDTIYAFDADDPNQSASLWQVNLGPAMALPDPGTNYKYPPYQDILNQVGILGTPVIDLSTNSIYLVAATKDGNGYHHYLHALDITSGAEKFGGPRLIQASVSGHGDGSVNGTLNFNSQFETQRPALLLLNGLVFVAFASYGDTDPYHGWIISYNAANLNQTAAYVTTPDGGEGGIWMSGQGLVADNNGYVYAMIGNGTPDVVNGGSGVGEAFVKLNGNNLTLADWFMPSNYASLNNADTDLGSAGPLLIPGTTTLLGGGKQGVLYLMNQNGMGHYNSTDSQVIQHFGATGGHIHGSPVYWNGPNGANVYVWGEYDYLKAFQLVNGTLNTTPRTSTMTVPNGMPGGFLSISAYGSTAGSGILWASTPSNGDAIHATVGGIVRAFDASNINNELWNSKMNPGRDDIGNFAKFNPPTVANGKLYMATFSNQLVVYGLISGAPTPVPPANDLIALNAGGGAVGPYAADNYFGGGTVAIPVTTAVDTSGVTNPAPQAVYQTERYGPSTYTLPGLKANTSYTVRLHFAETYWTTVGQRQFNVAINGTPILTNFDIVASAGGLNKAITKQFMATANGNGQIVVAFTTGSADQAKINAIEVSSNSTATPGGAIIALNAGGGAAAPYAADNYFSGGIVANPATTAVDTSGVTNPAPQAVYQTERYGPSTYTLPGLKANTSYTVRLHFAETYWTTAGQRQFNVVINGATVLTNFDIVASAGGASKAITRQFTVNANNNGQIVVAFTNGPADQAKINAIEVSNAPVYAINSGGGSTVGFGADAYFSGGQAAYTTTTINTTGVANPAPQAVYQSERWGANNYTFPGLTPGGTYTVRLHFAENYWTAAGQRQFNVAINGAAVLTNFDIFAATGGQYKAIVKQFTVTANGNGQIIIAYTTGSADQPKSSGIEILH